MRAAVIGAVFIAATLLVGPVAQAQEGPASRDADQANADGLASTESEAADPGPAGREAADPDAADESSDEDLTPEEIEAQAAAERLAAEQARVRGVGSRELAAVVEQLDAARQARDDAADALADARARLRSLLVAGEAADAEAESTRRELGNLARQTYASGPPAWAVLETFLEGDDPSDALRRASMSQRAAEAADEAWDRAVAEQVGLQRQIGAVRKQIRAWGTELAAAKTEVSGLEQQERAIEAALAEGGFAVGDGFQAVAEVCQDSPEPRCEPSGWAEGLLTRDAVWVMRTVGQKWPQVTDVGGYRAPDPYPDHPSGRAVDVMVPGLGHSAEGLALGDEVAEYFMEHAEDYGVMYLIWNQRIWSAGRDEVAPAAEWRVMADRGSHSANHVDHVHITVSTGTSGSEIYRAIAEAGR